jgi:hypothetical protein
MTKRIVGSSCVAAVFSLAAVAAGQNTAPPPTQAPVQGERPGAAAPAAPRDQAATASQMTIVGCIQKESEYLSTRGGGSNALGSGNEFVLVISPAPSSTASAAPSPAAPGAAGAGANPADSVGGANSASPAPGAPAVGGQTASNPSPGATGTSGSASATAGTSGRAQAYGLTGDREKDLSEHVGKRVQIVGTTERSSAGASAGSLQRVEIVSFTAMAGGC